MADRNRLRVRRAVRLLRRRWDVCAAFLLALVAGAGAMALHPFTLHPAVWREAAVAAHLRPADAVLPGVWRWCASALYAFFGGADGGRALDVFGVVLLGILAALFYLIEIELLERHVRQPVARAMRRLLVFRVAAAAGTLVFAFSRPVWTAMSAAGLSLPGMALLFGSVLFFLLAMRTRRVACACVAAFLCGWAAAETPLGLVFLVVGAFVCRRWQRELALEAEMSADEPDVPSFVWPSNFCALAGMLTGVWLATEGYLRHGGGAEGGLAVQTLGVYVRDWLARAGTAATFGGWGLAGLFVAGPVVLTYLRFPVAVDEERPLPYLTGLLFLVCAGVVFSQVASFSPVRLDVCQTAPGVRSPALAVLFAAGSAGALVRAAAVFGIRFLYGGGLRRSTGRRRATFAGALLFVVVAVGVGRIGSAVDARWRTVDAYLRAVGDDVRGCRSLFTDGRFDDALRLAFATRDDAPHLYACFEKGDSPVARTLLMQGLETAEDRLAAEQGAAVLLRTWVQAGGARLADCAAQVGFETWTRALKSVPPAWGTLVRTSGDAAARAASVDRARELADAAQALCAARRSVGGEDAAVQDAFDAVLWRLARMAAQRAVAFEQVGDEAAASAERARAAELDRRNGTLAALSAAGTRVQTAAARRFTPREALRLALAQADFQTAHRYAEKIVETDADDIPANFALAMSYASRREYARAERHFLRCVELDASDAVSWNNLAMTQIALGKRAEAEKSATRALELAPSSAAVRDTLSRIRSTAK